LRQGLARLYRFAAEIEPGPFFARDERDFSRHLDSIHGNLLKVEAQLEQAYARWEILEQSNG
jgi:hypothetical protein